MSASDTFEWFIAMISRDAGPEEARFAAEERSVFHALRSEDERQRFVEDLMNSYRRTSGNAGGKKAQRA
jgi:hypothetical protein